MEFSKLVSGRYSVRKYQSRSVEKDKVERILEAARVAPSAANKRPIQLIVVQEQAGLEKIKKAANAHGAPLVIIACGDAKTAGARPADGHSYLDVDVSIVTDHMMLQACDLGLGTCWIAAFDPKIIKDEFNIPAHVEPINLLAVGYADDAPPAPEQHDQLRKSIEEIVAYETL